ncbi:gamma-glutamyltransferase [Rhizobium sp. L1K21]|uniref:gamma-glutamyltransferase n=1 Tax=Rhizobium sp. L1K21 TaxID=2954933 RepID=UPI0020920A20|nr:gamma-glutamyltransferase [Rhizobium sp. L1K21]MCO6188590.1 gamma-glutamyltransferase [Rhizobium sp. L1K21]
MRDFQFPGRSPVRAMNGMAATSHPLSTLAALDVLRSGGNAIDAAICAAAVQAVVEPQSTGIGGDCFMLFCPAGTDEVIALNGSGRAPAAATIDRMKALGITTMPTFGPHTVTIPGAIDAWCRLQQDHGKLSMADVLAPAIRYAEEGYVIHDRVAFDWVASAELLEKDPHASDIFLPGGKAPKPGDVHRQPALGQTLKRIAAEGRDAFYKGPVAEAMVRRLNALGGVHTVEDFAAAACDYVRPISTDYRGMRIHQVPPNNQGLTALVMLNILSGFDLGGLDPNSADRFHLEVEAGRLAYRDRNERIGDADATAEVLSPLLSAERAQHLRSHIDPNKAMTDLPDPKLSTSDTVYISVVDADRNAVSFINSIYYSFGSGIVCPETGVLLQNRGASFRLDPSHPNALAPGKRPMHTIMPGMVTREGRAVMPYGVMGGDYQPFGHAHLLTSVIDFGMDVQQAIDSSRVFYQDDKVVAERSVPEKTVAELREKGHDVISAEEPLGGGQAIWIDWEQGTLTGASDPRKDGFAAGY